MLISYRHQSLLPFYTAFTDLGLAWGSQGQRKAKEIAFIFSHSYQLIRTTLSAMLKQFKLNILILL